MLQHSVLASRSQIIIKGDDTIQTHQIMQDKAYNAELTRAPVELAEGDVVRFFYPLQDPTQTDLIGYIGEPVGSYPCSTFTVQTAGLIIDPTGLTPNRGTSTFQSGLGQTVRGEITRLVTTVTGNLTKDSNTITGISDPTDLVVGQSVTSSKIPDRTVIEAINGSSIVISQNATASTTGASLAVGTKETQYLIDEVDVFERGFASSLIDTSGGINPPQNPLNLT